MCMKNCERCPNEHTSACIKNQPTEEDLNNMTTSYIEMVKQNSSKREE